VWVSARETIVAPGFAVDAVDSTAAGDTFNAALAVALAGERRGGIAEALEFANAAAAISVTRVGAQSSCPGHEDVAQLLSLSGRKAADVSRS
jgi:ribokinase